jgi:hypothetical protein
VGGTKFGKCNEGKGTLFLLSMTFPIEKSNEEWERKGRRRRIMFRLILFQLENPGKMNFSKIIFPELSGNWNICETSNKELICEKKSTN